MTITASIVGPTFVTVMVNGQTHTINSDHANYNKIREALKTKDLDLVEKLINVAKAVTKYVAGRVTVVGDKVMYGDHEVKGSVVQRIIAMLNEGFDAEPVIKFLENLMSNPSKRAVDELYGFLEATSLPITEDGCFLAYKKVNNDYMDFYTRRISNKLASLMSPQELAALPVTVGNVTTEVVNGVTTLSMPRNQVDDERDRTCSYGLHFCSLSYLPHYHGGAGCVLIVKINPADVVSIPSDYNNAKGRTCRYEVIGEHTSEYSEAWTKPVWVDSTDDLDDDIGEDEDDQFDNGYDAGQLAAENASNALSAYDATPPSGSSTSFVRGYVEGYAGNYRVDWYDVGYAAGQDDVNDSNSYEDLVPAACDDSNQYREGYADGWRDAKVEKLG